MDGGNRTGVKRIEQSTLTEISLSSPRPQGILRVLASSDLHMNLLGYDYYGDLPDPGIGLSRTATLIAQARDEAATMGAAQILLDNGDGLQGTPLGELFDAKSPHPLMRAFQVLGYDAIGLGNHDFNYGLEVLEHTLRDAPCPVICSNMVATTPERKLPFVASTVLERQVPHCPKAPPIKIGLLSVLPVQTLQWDSHQLDGRVHVKNMVEAARITSANLRAAGCDVVIALAHTGVGQEFDETEANFEPENALRKLALIDDIDALIGGHTHLHLPDPAIPFAKPVVMPGALGSHLGVIDLRLSHGPTGWKLDSWDCELRPISTRNDIGEFIQIVAEDPALVLALANAHAATLEWMKQPVGHSQQSLHSYFAFFAPDRALALVANAQAAALRPLLVGSAEEGLPVLSAVSPCKFGARSGPTYYTDVSAGSLCRRHVADLHVFPNQLNAVTLSGALVLEWLEMSAGIFNQVLPRSSGTALINPDRAGHNFDVLHGLEYQIDLSQPARFHASGQLADVTAHRICNASWNGLPIAPAQQFVVAVNSHRAGGGGNFSMVQHARQLTLPRRPIEHVIYNYLNGTLPSDPLTAAPPPWHLARLPETSVLAFTGPAARQYLHELAHLNLTPPVLTPDGFLQLTVPL